MPVEGDRDLLVELGDPESRRPIVYLHGMCSDPREDLEAWGGLAKEHGAIVALTGDVACPDGRTTKWSEDIAALNARVEAAVSAVNQRRETKLDPSELVLIGESMGAARAESLASAYPERFTRLVLVASPRQPSPRRLGGVKAVATLAGEKEPQDTMRVGTRALESAGYRARFWELPDATHGTYGPEGEQRMREAVAFVVAVR